MRILIVNPSSYIYGGAERVIVNLANYLSSHDIDNTLLTTNINSNIESKLINTEIMISSLEKSPHAEMMSLHKSVKQIEHRFDVINPHNYPAEMSIWGCKKPVVWQCNEPILGIKNDYQSLLMKLSNTLNLMFDRIVIKKYVDEVIVADLFNADRFTKIYNKIPKIIHYGIDVDDFNANRSVDYESFNMIQVGMIQPFKNQLESLKIVNTLKEDIPNIKLTLVGWALPTYKHILDEYIKLNNLQEYVTFIQHIDGHEMKKLYLSHDLLLHPIHSQGGWLTPFEALCTELPIIVSKEFTASGIIKQNDIGIVSDSNNYVKDILEIYNNRKESYIKAKRGKVWVNENLSWNRYCEQMLNVFNRVTNG